MNQNALHINENQKDCCVLLIPENMNFKKKKREEFREKYHKIMACYFSSNSFVVLESSVIKLKSGSVMYAR